MRAVVLFVKAPVAGFVKTRLAKEIGKIPAVILYRALAQQTHRVASVLPKTKILLAYQSHPALPRPTWLSPTSPWFHQHGKGLGERLVHAFGRAFQNGAGPVVVIGTDLPTLTPQRLAEAFRALQKVAV